MHVYTGPNFSDSDYMGCGFTKVTVASELAERERESIQSNFDALIQLRIRQSYSKSLLCSRYGLIINTNDTPADLVSG